MPLPSKSTQHFFQILQKYGFCKKVGVSSQTHSLSIYPQRELTTVTPRKWIMIETPLLRQYLRYLIVTFTFTTTQTLQSGVDVSHAWDGNMKHGATLLSWSPALSLYHQNILPFKVKVGAGNAVSHSELLSELKCLQWAHLAMRSSHNERLFHITRCVHCGRCHTMLILSLQCHLLPPSHIAVFPERSCPRKWRESWALCGNTLKDGFGNLLHPVLPNRMHTERHGGASGGNWAEQNLNARHSGAHLWSQLLKIEAGGSLEPRSSKPVS